MTRSGTEQRKRNRLLSARCNEEEFELAILKAEKAGLCLSALIRHLVLDEPKRKGTKRPPRSKRDTAQLIGLLGQKAQALRDYCQKRNISPDDPFIIAAWRDLAEMNAICFEILGRKQ